MPPPWPGSHGGGGPPLVELSAPLVLVLVLVPVVVVVSTPPLLLPGSPLLLLVSGTTPEVDVDVPGSPLVDDPVVPVALADVVGLVPVVTPFDSEPAEGSVALPSVAELWLVDPELEPPADTVPVPLPVPVPSSPGPAGSPHAARRRPRGATHDDQRANTVPDILTGYAFATPLPRPQMQRCAIGSRSPTMRIARSRAAGYARSPMPVNDRTLVAADGTQVAYHVHQGGPGPTLVLTNGITTSNFFWTYLHRRWAPGHTLINWDLKGHGRSGPARSPEGTSMSALADDLLRVLDAANIERAVLAGFSMGCQVTLELYRRAPERVSALVLLLGPAGRVFDTALGPVGKLLHGSIERMSPRVFALSLRGVQRLVGSPLGYPLGRGLRLFGPEATRADVQRFIDHFVEHIDPPSLAAMALAAQAHSAEDLLPRIAVPTLVVGGDSDLFAPGSRVAAHIARKIPRSELLRLPYGTHTSLLEHHAEIGAAVDEFLARRLPPT